MPIILKNNNIYIINIYMFTSNKNNAGSKTFSANNSI